MKRVLWALAGLLLSACGSDNPEQAGGPEFEPSTRNGRIVCALADAYAVFESTDRLPAAVTVDGQALDKGAYWEAAARLMLSMTDENADWEHDELTLEGYGAAPYPITLDTFAEDEVPVGLMAYQSEKQLNYAAANGVFANYCTFSETGYTAPDGTTCSGQLSFDRAAVIFARAFAHYRQHCRLPERLSSWQSDFLHPTLNCDPADRTVAGTLATAVSGKNGPREQAEAIFCYVRDHVTYTYYENTRHGAAGTLSGGDGNCCDHAHAVVAMARAAGIPARYVHARATYPSGTVYGHVWAELYVDGGWHLCDATGKENTFGNHENWVSFVLNSKQAELPF